VTHYGWDVTPCGSGCVNINGTYTAHLVNGSYEFDSKDDPAECSDGSRITNASDSHYSVDPVTLRGTAAITWKKAACGNNNVGQTFNHTIVLSR
jgi:hypothetical protein